MLKQENLTVFTANLAIGKTINGFECDRNGIVPCNGICHEVCRHVSADMASLEWVSITHIVLARPSAVFCHFSSPDK